MCVYVPGGRCALGAWTKEGTQRSPCSLLRRKDNPLRTALLLPAEQTELLLSGGSAADLAMRRRRGNLVVDVGVEPICITTLRTTLS